MERLCKIGKYRYQQLWPMNTAACSPPYTKWRQFIIYVKQKDMELWKKEGMDSRTIIVGC